MILAERIQLIQTCIVPIFKGYSRCCSFHIFVYSVERSRQMQLKLQGLCWLLASPLINHVYLTKFYRYTHSSFGEPHQSTVFWSC